MIGVDAISRTEELPRAVINLVRRKVFVRSLRSLSDATSIEPVNGTSDKPARKWRFTHCQKQRVSDELSIATTLFVTLGVLLVDAIAIRFRASRVEESDGIKAGADGRPAYAETRQEAIELDL
jgi:hypothetical protein